jgi:integrase
MRWSELDEARGTWTLPAARAKNNHAHTLPLPPAAWAIINSAPRLAARDHLFGVRAERGFSTWALAKSDLDGRLGGAVAHFVLHDLRRTVATKMADLGVQPHIIEEILNHRGGHKAGIAGIYNRSSAKVVFALPQKRHGLQWRFCRVTTSLRQNERPSASTLGVLVQCVGHSMGPPKYLINYD